MTEITEVVERKGPGPLKIIGDNEWRALLDKDDRTSPEEYPEMALITRAELGGAMCEAYILAAGQATEELMAWAVAGWRREVENRPLKNVHRRSLDTVWRQVIRRLGGDDVALIGPSHDDLLATLQGQQS